MKPWTLRLYANLITLGYLAAASVVAPVVSSVGAFAIGISSPYFQGKTVLLVFISSAIISLSISITLGFVLTKLLDYFEIKSVFAFVLAGFAGAFVAAAIVMGWFEFHAGNSSYQSNGTWIRLNGTLTLAGLKQYSLSCFFYGVFGALVAGTFWLIRRDIARESIESH